MIGAIILAAGRSSRMGSPKAMLEIAGSTFLDTVIRKCNAAGLSPIVAVVGHDVIKSLQKNAMHNVVLVENHDPDDGPIRSLAIGLNALNRTVDGALVWPVDQPMVSLETIHDLVGTFSAASPGVVVPSVDGRRGHPVVLSSRLFAEVAHAARQRRTLRDLVRADLDRVVVQRVADPAILEDIDTPEDYAALVSRGK